MKLLFFEIKSFIEGNSIDLSSQNILAVCNFEETTIRFYRLLDYKWNEIYCSIHMFITNYKKYFIEFARNTNRLFIRAKNNVYIYLFDFESKPIKFIKTDKIVFPEKRDFIYTISNVYNHEAMSPSILYMNYLSRNINFLANNFARKYLMPKPNIYLTEFSENDRFICFVNKEKETSELCVYLLPDFKFIYKFIHDGCIKNVFFYKDLFLIAIGNKENDIVFYNLHNIQQKITQKPYCLSVPIPASTTTDDSSKTNNSASTQFDF